MKKILKALLAYQNKKILKTHDLYEIYKDVKNLVILEDYISMLDQISEYHIEESYPAFNRTLPPRDEIKEVLIFTEELFEKVCKIINIDIYEVKI